MTLPSIRIEGAILSSDILGKLDTGDVSGQRPADFGCRDVSALKEDILQAWTSAQAYYRAFQARVERLPESSPATTETRNLWIIPLLGLLGYTELEFQQSGELVGDKPFRFSHRLRSHGGFVVHIVGARDSLDKKRADGTGRSSPHGYVQEYLNLTEHLFALTTNGRVLRLLRDATRLVKLSYVEFDLDRMFQEDLFADFCALYRLLHVSRLPKMAEESGQSLLERYHQDALDSGSAIRKELGKAVESVILALGTGFLNHPANHVLRETASTNNEFPLQLYRHLLRLVYRLLFLMVVEERDILYAPRADARKRALYYAHYSLARLRRLAEKKHLTDLHHTDVWTALRSTFRLFDESGSGQPLGLAPLGGDLFDSASLGLLTDATLDNDTLLTCLRNLALFENPATKQRMRVNYAALNVEEFGSVYQGLLEYEPAVSELYGRWTFHFVMGDERSRTGSHYTPEELVQPLLKHSLDHLIADCLKKPTKVEKEKALLSLKVCDVACGSGHILLAAARRIGTDLAVLRTGDDQPSPTAFRESVRDVIRHCIYGMDLNPLAVELCKVALWLEAHLPGQALSFLDHRIKCGNAIVGLAHRSELERGIPDEAFKTLPGDDKAFAAELRKQNKDERKGKLILPHFSVTLEPKIHDLDEAYRTFDQAPDNAVTDYQTRRQHYEQFQHHPHLQALRQLADAQVAQFYLLKTPDNRGKHVTQETFKRWLTNLNPSGEGIAAATTISERKRFGHWFIEFWDVVDAGGFDLIIGNPPYLGGQALSGSYGHAFCEWVKWEYAPAGISDLVVYFVRRIYDLLKPGGFMAFITTNSIKDGDIRKDGLEQIISKGATINMAVRAIKWPGVANLTVSLISISKQQWSSSCTLDGRSVPYISAFLDDDPDIGKVPPLSENHRQLMVGTHYLGDGFVITPEQAQDLIKISPSNKEVVFPLFNCDELNSLPTPAPKRFIIDFALCSEHHARSYQAPFAIVESLVKTERATEKEARLREQWWLFKRPFVEFRNKARMLDRVFVSGITTKHLNFTAVPPDTVFSHAVCGLASDRWDLFSVIQSSLHDLWARKLSGAHEVRLRYSPSNCFETFAFPEGLFQQCNASLSAIGERYHNHRSELMILLWLGLTDVYNILHSPDIDARLVKLFQNRANIGDWKRAESAPPELYSIAGSLSQSEARNGILRLRELQRQLDQAVLAAYGWHEPGQDGIAIQLTHDFYQVETLPENDRTRFTISPEARREVLARLLKLNHQRAADQEAKVVAAKPKARAPQAKALQFPATDLPLFQTSTQPVPVITKPGTFRERVAAFDFTLPTSTRRIAGSSAEFYLTLIPAMVQEAGGTLLYQDLIEGLIYLSNPQSSPAAAANRLQASFGKWKKSFPKHLVDAGTLRASLHDQIVERHMLNIRPRGEDFELFQGIQPVTITLPWVLTDARIALAHASVTSTAGAHETVSTVKPQTITHGNVWSSIIQRSELQQWASAA